MSLINDALKKAQSMQPTGQAGGLKLASKPLTARPTAAHPAPLGPQAVTPSPESPVVPAGKPKGARPGMILALAGGVFLAAVCLVAVAGVMIWKGGSSESTEVATTTEPQSSAPSASEPSVVATAPAEPVVAPEPVAPEPTPVAPADSEATSISITPTTSDPGATPAEATEPAGPRLPSRPKDPKLQAYALSIRVAGIRTGDKPKALMNDRVYSIGEYVSPEHDLRLSRVDERMLELEDSAGNIYEVRF